MANETLMANAIRALAMDAVQQANSGHPGAPMGMAEIAVALWGRHLRHNPANPHWADRDRFLMEGVSHEACALAAAWKLNKLVAIYDDNGISIDGQVAPWFVDDTPARFRAYGWNVIGPIDGHDLAAVDRAIADAKLSATKPTLIVCKTQIGKGSPNRVNTAKAHGEALGIEEVKLTREALGWPHEPFVVPGEVYTHWDAKAKGRAAEAKWNERFAAYAKA